MWRSLVKRTPKEGSPHRNPPQSGNPQVSGIQEMPDNQRILELAELDQQARTMPSEVTFDTEVIIALMGLTGTNLKSAQNLHILANISDRSR